MTARIPPPATPRIPLSATAAPRAPAPAGRALQLARASYGAALVLAPGPVILLATGHLPDRRACRVARLLGARHLAQATLTALAPLPAVFGAGAEVDALHAASMLMLAAVDRAARRAALTDTVAEAAFAAVGLAVAAPRAAAARRAGTRR